jgi:hypothetical protein
MGLPKNLYDPSLLAMLRHVFEGNATQPIQTAHLSAQVAVKDLVKGMVLRSNVETKGGILILTAGNQINEMTLQKIRNFDSIMGIAEPIMVETPV